MTDLVGPIAVAGISRNAAAARPAQPTMPSADAGSAADAQLGLAWNTPMGQILFLQSVDDDRRDRSDRRSSLAARTGARSQATPLVWSGVS
jgi:hypothetical protein